MKGELNAVTNDIKESHLEIPLFEGKYSIMGTIHQLFPESVSVEVEEKSARLVDCIMRDLPTELEQADSFRAALEWLNEVSPSSVGTLHSILDAIADFRVYEYNKQ